MALKKSQKTLSGVTAEYFQLVQFRWDRKSREASFIFDLWLNEETSKTPGAIPIKESAVKMRLTGEEFTEILNPSQIGELVSKAYSLAKEGGGNILSDFGTEVLTSSIDV